MLLRTNDAAALIGVDATTLKRWADRYGFPTPRGNAQRREWAFEEVATLSDALAGGVSAHGAVELARRRLQLGELPLRRYLERFDAPAADTAMEAALAVRSLDSAVTDILLPAVTNALAGRDADSPRAAFAVRWAIAWLTRAQRASAVRPAAHTVVLADAGSGIDAVHLAALELLLSAGQVRAIAVPVSTPDAELGDAIADVAPVAIIVAGAARSEDDIVRWARLARRDVRPPVWRFRGTAAGEGVLPSETGAAALAIVARLDGRRAPVAR